MKILWLLVYLSVFVWSAIEPKEYFTWFLEVLPALIALLIIAVSYNRFRLTSLSYLLILLHCLILMVGGHYTYAEVPLFDTLAQAMDWQRNHYDKLGHLAQGFVPAIIAREILIRFEIVAIAAWRNFFIVSFCLGFSAFYEIIEWWVALASGEDAEAFLGTQGYIWDTQSDMAMALLGALVALLLLSTAHDGQLRRMQALSD